MKIAFYGSSLLSSYWNGAATYYRGILQALAGRGYEITFLEPDVFGRQQHRDIEPPDWCRVVVFPATPDGLAAATAQAGAADVVVKASGVGFADEELLRRAMAQARPDALRVWWDVDAPATLAEIATDAGHPLRAALPQLDLVLTYGGGEPVRAAYRALGAADCQLVYNALDPATHHPVAPRADLAADLAFLGNRLPDREARVEEFFLGAAERLASRRFLLGGAGWDDRSCPDNVRTIGHVPTASHNAFNVSSLAVLNVTRASMAANGLSPPTRVFEAAGAGACLITDDWPGVDQFLTPDEEVLVARDGRDVAEALAGLTAGRARSIGRAALARVLAEHTYERRAVGLDGLLRAALRVRRVAAA